MEAPDMQTRPRSSERAGGAQDEVAVIGGQPSARGPASVRESGAPGSSESVSLTPAKATRLSELMITVGAPVEHAQVEIDLGAGARRQRRGHGVRPAT